MGAEPRPMRACGRREHLAAAQTGTAAQPCTLVNGGAVATADALHHAGPRSIRMRSMQGAGAGAAAHVLRRSMGPELVKDHACPSNTSVRAVCLCGVVGVLVTSTSLAGSVALLYAVLECRSGFVLGYSCHACFNICRTLCMRILLAVVPALSSCCCK